MAFALANGAGFLPPLLPLPQTFFTGKKLYTFGRRFTAALPLFLVTLFSVFSKTCSPEELPGHCAFPPKSRLVPSSTALTFSIFSPGRSLPLIATFIKSLPPLQFPFLSLFLIKSTTFPSRNDPPSPIKKEKKIMSSSASGAHILVFPHPAQGHLIPLLDLTYHLSTRGLSITVLVTPKNLPLIQPLLSKSPTSIHPLILPFPTHPSIPPGVENVKDLPPTSSTADIVRALSSLQEPIIQWFESHPNPPVAIVSDFFLGWTEGLARRLSVPRIVFHSVHPFLVSVLNHLWPRIVGPTDELVAFDDLPNKPSFGYPHLPAVYRRCVELGSPGSDWEFMREGLIANTTSWGGAYNTFQAIEGDYLEHVREKGGHVRTWAVGPVFIGGVGHAGRGGSGTVADGDVISWLDACPDGSVVYVCFGSEVLLTRIQMAELAAALEKSGARFVWVVKVAPPGHAAEKYGVVPDGFEGRTAGRGLVIRGWAPQAAILGHPAVAAFLTHCGWNSVLEGLVAGVTLLAWPMGADQFVNARLLVENTGVAVRVCEGLETVPDSAELARAVAESLSGSRPEKVRAMEMKKVALDAVKEGGSSYSDLDGLVKELSALGIKKNGVKE